MENAHSAKERWPKKRIVATVILGVILLLLCAYFLTQLYAAHMAKQHFLDLYGHHIATDYIAADHMVIDRIRISLKERQIYVNAAYGDVHFGIDVTGNTDNFAPAYVEQRYADLIFVGDADSYLSSIDVVLTDPASATPHSLDNNDFRFYLMVSFREPLADSDAFAEKIYHVVTILRELGLTGCDTLEAFATVNGMNRNFRFSPSMYPSIDAQGIRELF